MAQSVSTLVSLTEKLVKLGITLAWLKWCKNGLNVRYRRCYKERGISVDSKRKNTNLRAQLKKDHRYADGI